MLLFFLPIEATKQSKMILEQGSDFKKKNKVVIKHSNDRTTHMGNRVRMSTHASHQGSEGYICHDVEVKYMVVSLWEVRGNHVIRDFHAKPLLNPTTNIGKL